MQPFKHHILAGTIPNPRRSDGQRCKVFVTVKWGNHLNPTHPFTLSVSGVVGPYVSGNCAGSCGQCLDVLTDPAFRPADGIDAKRLHDVWNRWHLNDMRAGSPAQEAYLREHPVTATYPESHYEKVKAALAAAGLQPDNGYSYGSAWLREEVPADVLEWLHALPQSDLMPSVWAR